MAQSSEFIQGKKLFNINPSASVYVCYIIKCPKKI